MIPFPFPRMDWKTSVTEEVASTVSTKWPLCRQHSSLWENLPPPTLQDAAFQLSSSSWCENLEWSFRWAFSRGWLLSFLFKPQPAREVSPAHRQCKYESRWYSRDRLHIFTLAEKTLSVRCLLLFYFITSTECPWCLEIWKRWISCLTTLGLALSHARPHQKWIKNNQKIIKVVMSNTNKVVDNF